MDRAEFIRLRDLPGKTIEEDIILQRKPDTSPLLATTVKINNSAGTEARLRVELNEMTDCKTLNVSIPGTGPICRLEVDSRPHKPHGRSHKHSLQSFECPSFNLPNKIIDKSELAGKSIQEVFIDFCQHANIEHHGSFRIAD